jgi:hypothetical protein
MTQKEFREFAKELHPAAKVEFTLPDSNQVYTMIWDFNMLCRAEQETGENLMSFIQEGGITGLRVRAMLYAVLRTAHSISIEEAGQLLNKGFNHIVLAQLARVVAFARTGEEDLVADVEGLEPDVEVPAAPVAEPPIAASA